jgi:hypothetical protein
MKHIATVRDGGFRETLSWDEDADTFSLSRTFIEVGQTMKETLTESKARACLARWGEADRLEDTFSVEEVDEYLTDLVMEGEEWHPLKKTP